SITEISKNLIHLFYVSEKYRKLSLEDRNIPIKEIRKCGVLGAGIMGGGIAQLLSSHDIWVRLKDINHEAVAKGYQAAGKVYGQAVQKRRLTKAQAASKMAKITGALDYSGFNNADLIIEAVVEKMEVKKKVFKELSDIAAPDAILATNTSALSVEEMAKDVKDPSRVVGFHFFNPVHRMPLVEVITTSQTSQETIATALHLAKSLRKTPILVKDSCGFLVNRILLGYINEAGRLLEETGELEEIDKIMVDFGMPMGPFTLSDEVGLDVGIKVMHILNDAFGRHFQPTGIFEKVYEKGLLGRKSGKGFYIHSKRREVNSEVLNLVKVRKPVSAQDCCDRLILPMINEAALCLEEGIVDEAAAVDVGMIFGTGFPPFRGGLLKYADHVGIPVVIDTLNELCEKYKTDRFKPCPYLLKLQEQKKGFFD
ncbi:MAG: fatty-acid oxidation protein subunit alpha, partial [Candidatus Omnitrophica bacterium]|nr:fatty-acid oxidation protein subunit alpha [Candidatus Omnitrophota bacterium]